MTVVFNPEGVCRECGIACPFPVCRPCARAIREGRQVERAASVPARIGRAED